MICPTHVLLGLQKNGEELLGTRITHFEQLHVFSLHARHGAVLYTVTGKKHLGFEIATQHTHTYQAFEERMSQNTNS